MLFIVSGKDARVVCNDASVSGLPAKVHCWRRLELTSIFDTTCDSFSKRIFSSLEKRKKSLGKSQKVAFKVPVIFFLQPISARPKKGRVRATPTTQPNPNTRPKMNHFSVSSPLRASKRFLENSFNLPDNLPDSTNRVDTQTKETQTQPSLILNTPGRLLSFCKFFYCLQHLQIFQQAPSKTFSFFSLRF